LVTLGNLLSHVSHERIKVTSLVEDVMFDFRKIKEVVTNLSLIGSVRHQGGLEKKKRSFEEITLDTPLDTLTRFFEHNSAAVVTEKSPEGGYKPIHVVTKVDLLAYLVKSGGLDR